jgi:hypothetical protein
MRKTLLIISLLAAGSASARADNQPENSADFICSTEEEAERLGQLIQNDGLASKGVDPPTTYCLADIKILWDSCAKAKGVKRRKWCELVNSYCKEINRQLDAAYDVRTRRLEREETERLRRNREDRERQKRGVDYETGMLFEMMAPLVDMASKPITITPLARELQPSQCYGLPEPEGSKPKGGMVAPSGSSSGLFVPSVPIPMATPLPSYGAGSSHTFEASPSRDTSRCMTNKIICGNGCDNVPNYGSMSNEIFAIRQRCNDSCESNYRACIGR